MAKFVSRSSAHTKRIAATLLGQWRLTRRPLVLALAGELGSGKTTFVQGLARTLGIREKIQSPTFVLMKRYRLPKRLHRLHRFHRVHHFIHIDAYRLDSLAEARHLGLPGTLRDRDAVIAIEWADRIRRLIPRSAIWIQFKHGKNTRERVIELGKRVK